MTKGVITRWYRPPEILYGARFYSEKVDVWSMGCIFAELILKTPLFPGESDIMQLSRIFGIVGTPNKKNWPGVEKLARFIPFKTSQGIPLKKILTDADEEEIDIIQSMLRLNPSERPSLKDILSRDYFKDVQDPSGLMEIVKKASD